MNLDCIQKNDLVIVVIILTVLVLYLLYRDFCVRKEPFSTTSAELASAKAQITPAIKAAVNEVYSADIEALRNLSNIAAELVSSNTLIHPGILKVTNNIIGQKDLTISGTLNINSKFNVDTSGNLIMSGAIKLGSAYLKLDDSWVRLLSNSGNIDSWDKGFAAQDLFAKNKLYAGDRDILGEIDAIKASLDRKVNIDDSYFIYATVKGGILSDQGNGIFQWNRGPWEQMKFIKV